MYFLPFYLPSNRQIETHSHATYTKPNHPTDTFQCAAALALFLVYTARSTFIGAYLLINFSFCMQSTTNSSAHTLIVVVLLLLGRQSSLPLRSSRA